MAKSRPTKAYVVRRNVRAVDEMLVYADNAADAEQKARQGEYEWTERLPSVSYGGVESVRRYAEEDRPAPTKDGDR